VWLGPGNLQTRRLMKQFQAVLGKEGRRLNIELNKLKTSRAFASFCHANYWRRVWIVQEVMAGRKIQLYYGGSSLDWECLDAVTLKIKARNEDSSINSPRHLGDFISNTDAGRIINFKESWKRSRFRSKASAMDFLIDRFSGMESTDARDKIFALSGLLDDANAKVDDFSINVDYSRSLSSVLTDTFQRLDATDKYRVSDAKLDLMHKLRNTLKGSTSESHAVTARQFSSTEWANLPEMPQFLIPGFDTQSGHSTKMACEQHSSKLLHHDNMLGTPDAELKANETPQNILPNPLSGLETLDDVWPSSLDWNDMQEDEPAMPEVLNRVLEIMMFGLT
jgi:hypothetical protein